MEKILTGLLQNKGTRSYRTVLLAAIVYVVQMLHQIEKRVENIERQHGFQNHASLSSTNSFQQ